MLKKVTEIEPFQKNVYDKFLILCTNETQIFLLCMISLTHCSLLDLMIY